MEENKEIVNEKDAFVEDFKKEILKNSQKELTKEEIKKLTEEAMVSIDFLKKIEEVEIPSDKYVVFTDGEEQLYYENGEFFVISTTDSKKERKKKTKKEATDMYLDFFIKYQLNPILDQRGANNAPAKKEIQKEKEQLAKAILEKDAVQEKAQVEQTKTVDKDDRMI